MPEWSEDNKSQTGLPRPHAIVMDRKCPIPWQSAPNYKSKKLLLIQEHEDRVYSENLCAFCGLEIKAEEESIRWTNEEGVLTGLKDRVPSDNHPFHLECMRQGRIFCPFMKNVLYSEFQISTYGILVDTIHTKIKGMNQ